MKHQLQRIDMLCQTRVCGALRKHYEQDLRHAQTAANYKWDGRIGWTPRAAPRGGWFKSGGPVADHCHQPVRLFRR